MNFGHLYLRLHSEEQDANAASRQSQRGNYGKYEHPISSHLSKLNLAPLIPLICVNGAGARQQSGAKSQLFGSCSQAGIDALDYRSRRTVQWKFLRPEMNDDLVFWVAIVLFFGTCAAAGWVLTSSASAW